MTRHLLRISFAILAAIISIKAIMSPKTVQAPQKYRSDLNVTPQAAAPRVWRERHFHALTSLGGLRFPQELASDGDGNVFVIEYGERRIKMFSAGGSLSVIGDAHLLRNPNGIAVGEGRTLWVADLEGQKVVQFSYDNKLLRQFTTETKPVRVVSTMNAIITLTLPLKENLFERYTFDGTFQNAFGRYLSVQTGGNGVVLDGELAASDRETVYAGYRVGLISAFRNDGQMHYTRETVTSLPMPATIARKKGCRGIAPASVGVSVLGNRVYVTTNTRVVDVYNLNNGDYNFSFKLPHPCSAVSLQLDRAYCLSTEKEILRWEMTD